jgi:hypothetical protein
VRAAGADQVVERGHRSDATKRRTAARTSRSPWP